MKDDVNKFLDYIVYERKYSNNTETNYEDDLFKFQTFINLEHLNYINLTYGDVSKYVIFLQNSGYTSSSINRNLSALRTFYNYLQKVTDLSINPFELVTSLKTDKKLPNYFKYKEFEDMIEVLNDDNPLTIRNRLLLELLLSTGMRVSEISNIMISDIDFNNNEIKVLGKGSKERIVYYNDHSRVSMYYYLKDARSVLLRNKSSNYLFINNNGTKLTDRGVRLIIENIIKKACIKTKITPHTFRHTFATMLLNEGADIRSVQELLGHANLSTTSIYTHLTNEQIRKVYLDAHPRAKGDFNGW